MANVMLEILGGFYMSPNVKFFFYMRLKILNLE